MTGLWHRVWFRFWGELFVHYGYRWPLGRQVTRWLYAKHRDHAPSRRATPRPR